jgi:hypothetical protein
MILAYGHSNHNNAHAKVWKPPKTLCQKGQTCTIFLLSEGIAVTINNSDRRIANPGPRVASRFLFVPQAYPAVVMELPARQRGICAGVSESSTIKWRWGSHKFNKATSLWRARGRAPRIRRSSNHGSRALITMCASPVAFLLRTAAPEGSALACPSAFNPISSRWALVTLVVPCLARWGDS